jgi:tRNA 2-thiocytidine biosynthesis protein TtcA
MRRIFPALSEIIIIRMSSTPERLAYWLLKPLNQAVREFGMLADGDRVAVALSGGKDSLSLLRLLDWRRRSAPERYELTAIHVLGDGSGPLRPHLPLVDWLEANGYACLFEPFALAEDECLPLGCQRCTWNRRKILFETARRLGCNVVAFGHHADDLAQTTLLNLIYNGAAETVAPRRDFFDGQIRAIRPLCYIPEADLRHFARACDFPPAPPACPQAETSRRRLAAELLRQALRASPAARTNLLRAGIKYMNTAPPNTDLAKR